MIVKGSRAKRKVKRLPGVMDRCFPSMFLSDVNHGGERDDHDDEEGCDDDDVESRRRYDRWSTYILVSTALILNFLLLFL